MLAGLFKAPTKYAPHVNLPAARARAADVLHNMVEAGYLTEGQIQSALRNPATPVTRSRDISADYYLDWAFNEIKKLVDEGKLKKERVLVVKTPLDLAIQKRADQAVENVLRQFGDAFDVEQRRLWSPWTGWRRAGDGRRGRLRPEPVQRATDALRQPGSSYKPYVYAAALATGSGGPTARSSTGRSASATGARPITAARSPAPCRCGSRWPNRSTPSRCSSRSPWASSSARPTMPAPPSSAGPRSSSCPIRWASPRTWSNRSRCRSARPR